MKLLLILVFGTSLVYSNTDDFSTLKWNGGAPIAGSKGRCRYNNQVWPHGSEFLAIDNCNTCICHNGEVKCTHLEMECIEAGRASETNIVAPTQRKHPDDEACYWSYLRCKKNPFVSERECYYTYNQCNKELVTRQDEPAKQEFFAPTERKRSSSCRDGNNNIRPHLSSWDELDTHPGLQCYKQCGQMTCDDGRVFCEVALDPASPCDRSAVLELSINSLTSYSMSENLAGSASETRIVVPTERKRKQCRDRIDKYICHDAKGKCHHSALVRKYCAWACHCSYPLDPHGKAPCDCY